MRRNELQALRCPIEGKELDLIEIGICDVDDVVEGRVMCSQGHSWAISEGMLSLVNMGEVSEEDKKLICDYDEHSEEYDEKIKLYDSFLKVDMMKERQQVMALIPLIGGSKVVDVSIGTALNFIALNDAEPDRMRKAFLYGVDLSKGMLKVARRKLCAIGLRSILIHADVNRRYPFPDDYFEAVVNTGGINTYSNISLAFSEMLRICIPGGMVLVSDEGLSPMQEKTEFGQRIASQNRLFESEPPLELEPHP